MLAINLEAAKIGHSFLLKRDLRHGVQCSYSKAFGR